MNRYYQLLTILTLLVITSMGVYGDCGPELVVNGDFATNADHWYKASDGDVIDGTDNLAWENGAVRYNGNGVGEWNPFGQAQLYEVVPGTIPPQPVGNYTVSINAYGTGNFALLVGEKAYTFGTGDFSAYSPRVEVSNESFADTVHYYEFIAEITAPTNTVLIEELFGAPSNFIVDNISVRSGFCLTPTQTCGNGIVEGTEECDDGHHNGLCENTCSSSCTNNTCPSYAAASSGCGWDLLLNASLVGAAYCMYDDAFGGWFIFILLLLFQFMIMMKTRSALPGLTIMFLFIGLYHGGLAASLITPMPPAAMGIIYLITTILIGAVLYNIFGKRN